MRNTGLSADKFYVLYMENKFGIRYTIGIIVQRIFVANKKGHNMSNYIMDLRKVVGHAPLLQAGASIIVENENGQVLLEKRTDNHQWGYAGGSIELGETVEEAAKRELFEEMGLVADEMELFYINSGEETHYIYPNGDEVYNVEIIYICRKYHGTIKRQEEEVEELKFFDVDDIPEDISDPIRPVFREYIKMRKRE